MFQHMRVVPEHVFVKRVAVHKHRCIHIRARVPVHGDGGIGTQSSGGYEQFKKKEVRRNRVDTVQKVRSHLNHFRWYRRW